MKTMDHFSFWTYTTCSEIFFLTCVTGYRKKKGVTVVAVSCVQKLLHSIDLVPTNALLRFSL